MSDISDARSHWLQKKRPESSIPRIQRQFWELAFHDRWWRKGSSVAVRDMWLLYHFANAMERSMRQPDSTLQSAYRDFVCSLRPYNLTKPPPEKKIHGPGNEKVRKQNEAWETHHQKELVEKVTLEDFTSEDYEKFNGKRAHIWWYLILSDKYEYMRIYNMFFSIALELLSVYYCTPIKGMSGIKRTVYDDRIHSDDDASRDIRTETAVLYGAEGVFKELQGCQLKRGFVYKGDKIFTINGEEPKKITTKREEPKKVPIKGEEPEKTTIKGEEPEKTTIKAAEPENPSEPHECDVIRMERTSIAHNDKAFTEGQIAITMGPTNPSSPSSKPGRLVARSGADCIPRVVEWTERMKAKRGCYLFFPILDLAHGEKGRLYVQYEAVNYFFEVVCTTKDGKPHVDRLGRIIFDLGVDFQYGQASKEGWHRFLVYHDRSRKMYMSAFVPEYMDDRKKVVAKMNTQLLDFKAEQPSKSGGKGGKVAVHPSDTQPQPKKPTTKGGKAAVHPIKGS